MDLLLVKCAAVLWNYYLSASAFFLNVDLGWGPMGQAMAEGLVRALQKSGWGVWVWIRGLSRFKWAIPRPSIFRSPLGRSQLESTQLNCFGNLTQGRALDDDDDEALGCLPGSKMVRGKYMEKPEENFSLSLSLSLSFAHGRPVPVAPPFVAYFKAFPCRPLWKRKLVASLCDVFLFCSHTH